MNPGRQSPSRALARATAILALLAGAACAQAGGALDADARFEKAMLAYERNHWDEAYAAFAALADGGDREAARIALLMQRHAKDLYGSALRADPGQVRHWSCLATGTDAAIAPACR